MFTSNNQSGGALLELTILAFLFTLIAGGSLRLHASLHRRYTKILQERNEGIRRARSQAPEFLSAGGEPFFTHLRNTRLSKP